MAGISSAAAVAVVLVHGGFVDGSGWEDVYHILKNDGFDVSVVQNSTASLAGDVAATRQVIDAQDKPVVLMATRMAGWSSPSGATTRRSQHWSTSRPSPPTPASPSTR